MHTVEKDHQRPTKYRAHHCKLNFYGIEFPVNVTDVEKFERQTSAVAASVFACIQSCLIQAYKVGLHYWPMVRISTV